MIPQMGVLAGTPEAPRECPDLGSRVAQTGVGGLEECLKSGDKPLVKKGLKVLTERHRSCTE